MDVSFLDEDFEMAMVNAPGAGHWNDRRGCLRADCITNCSICARPDPVYVDIDLVQRCLRGSTGDSYPFIWTVGLRTGTKSGRHLGTNEFASELWYSITLPNNRQSSNDDMSILVAATTTSGKTWTFPDP